MPASIHHHAESRYVEVQLTGKVTETDYETLGPEIEQLIQAHGKLRVLVQLNDFEGWTFKGLWEDIKFDARHFNDIERLAIVGEKRWHEGMAVFCKPFTTAKIRYFENFEIDQARSWLQLESPTEPAFAERPSSEA
jgi:hypothetical protein